LNFIQPENGTVFYRGETINITIYANTSLGDPFDDLEINLTFYLPNESFFVIKAENVGNGIYKANYTIKNDDPVGYWIINANSFKKHYEIIPSNVTIEVHSKTNLTLLSPTEEELYYGFSPGEKTNYTVRVTDENGKVISDGNVEIIF